MKNTQLYKVLLALYIIICIFLIAIILIQKSSSAIANFSSSQGSKHRADSNLITKITGIIGALFMIISLILCKLNTPTKIIENKIQEQKTDPNKRHQDEESKN